MDLLNVVVQKWHLAATKVGHCVTVYSSMAEIEILWCGAISEDHKDDLLLLFGLKLDTQWIFSDGPLSRCHQKSDL